MQELLCLRDEYHAAKDDLTCKILRDKMDGTLAEYHGKDSGLSKHKKGGARKAVDGQRATRVTVR